MEDDNLFVALNAVAITPSPVSATRTSVDDPPRHFVFSLVMGGYGSALAMPHQEYLAGPRLFRNLLNRIFKLGKAEMLRSFVKRTDRPVSAIAGFWTGSAKRIGADNHEFEVALLEQRFQSDVIVLGHPGAAVGIDDDRNLLSP